MTAVAAPSALEVFVARMGAKALLWCAGEIDLHDAVDELQAAAVHDGLVADLPDLEDDDYDGSSFAAACREADSAIEAAVAPHEKWRELIRVGPADRSRARQEAIAGLSGHLLRRRVDPLVTLDLLQCWNALCCNPPLGRDEVAATVRAINNREQRRCADLKKPTADSEARRGADKGGVTNTASE
jgi:hypothetical protein